MIKHMMQCSKYREVDAYVKFLAFCPVTTGDVMKLSVKLQTSSPPGLDLSPMWLLKEHSNVLLPFSAALYNMSLRSSCTA